MKGHVFRRVAVALAVAALVGCVAVLLGKLWQDNRKTTLLLRSPAPAPTVWTTASPTGRLNINTASQAQLETLPGIGPETARRIVEEREQNGPFYYPESLLSVKGIGPKTLERLREHICCLQPDQP